MPRATTYHLSRILGATILVLGLATMAGSSAAAGGWAVGSLDTLPEARAGATVAVGFSILQHGVTPVDLTEDVGIEIRLPDGDIDYFPAAGDGAPGHYVARVTFPTTAGSYTWTMRMGWFGPQELGTLDVNPPAGGGPTSWPAVRWVAPVLAVALAAVAITDLAVGRRRRRMRFV
jgi:hypothetical protein